jgi:formylglycine-generating enzyme required for sulfatase activity
MTKLGQASREQARRFAAEKPVADATKGMPFENSLGMKFVPVPVRAGPSKDLRVLFSVWETRRQDYAAYANTNPSVNGEWKAPKFPGGAGAAHKDNHPAVCVSMLDAVGFCKWLTDLERKAGKIGMNDTYRLPTDAEWSYAVGIGDKEDAEESPKAKDCKIADVYPWGTTWPRPGRVGNYSEVPLFDGFETTAPVGSFPANDLGLHDLGGNVWECCLNSYDGPDDKNPAGPLRGGSWYYSNSKNECLSSRRCAYSSNVRVNNIGFRCVLVAAGL